jgi:hypothetical protein
MMDTSKKRLIELALLGLELEKGKIDIEINELRNQLNPAPQEKAPVEAVVAAPGKKPRRAVKISAEEAKRRSERMRTYWDNWRKQKQAPAKGTPTKGKKKTK